ncbi:MAG TPA: serine/threonine-protein kinase [Planctomycetaceae bacterium]|nr:serine/threonine-protein kinase [Planctomycetaceae bacterium]
MKTREKSPDCDQVNFDVLLYGEETSAEFLESQRHVEYCAECQDRLAQTAADDGQWAEAQSLLSSDAGEAANVAPRGGRMKLDFLSPPAHPELLGQLGRYQIEQVIGAGGMGIVLKGFDTDLNRPVAVKVLAPHLSHSGAARQRFSREARAAAAVVHEHVVAIYNVESEEETPFLVIQYVPGRSLQDRVDQDGPLAAEEILRIGMQAAAGLAAAHAQGVIHRDVKPANILLESGVERALLTDFGLARVADDASLTHSGIVAGTPHYMSPEQARGETADARSDLFSLGAVLYFMATGHPPFRAEQAMVVLNRICHDRPRPVREINRKIPDELADVIDRLLEKKPSRRFASAAEVQQALAAVLKELQSPGSWRRARRFKHLVRRRQPIILATVALGIVVGGLVWIASEFGIKSAPTEKPRAKSVAAAPSAADILALELGTQRSDFLQQLAHADESLQSIAGTPYPEASLGAAINDEWKGNAQSAASDLSHLEALWSIENPTSHSLKGQKP